MADPIYINNDMVATLKGLKDEAGTAVTGAVVNITLLSDGTEISGETWPLTMTHTSGGDYEVELSDSLNLTSGQRITAKIVALSGGKKLEVIYRTNASERTVS